MSEMKLKDYLAGIQAAATAADLEAAIQAPFKHAFHGRTWAQICKARIERGQAIVLAHPNGQYVPFIGPRRVLSVCGETYKMAVGRNGAGARYAWHYAKTFAAEVLMRNGLSRTASHLLLDGFSDYPHRCLATVEKALAGQIPDPELDVMRFSYLGQPVQYSLEQNDADDGDQRAHQACPKCSTGTLFDWGGGYATAGFPFVSWHCNGCGAVYTEYMTDAKFTATRNPIKPKAQA